MDVKMEKAKTTRPPDDVLKKIREERDKDCVYCHRPFIKGDNNASATVEHLNHRKDWDSVGSYVAEGKDVSKIVAICCHACNSSRSDKSLLEWFKTPYSKSKNINYDKVATVVRDYIDAYEK